MEQVDYSCTYSRSIRSNNIFKIFQKYKKYKGFKDNNLRDDEPQYLAKLCNFIIVYLFDLNTWKVSVL